MSKIHTVHQINVATASFPLSLVLSSRVSRYNVYGSKAMTSSHVITYSGTPREGMEVDIDYCAAITVANSSGMLGDYSLVIFGATVPYSYLAKKMKIHAEYVNAGWKVYMLPSLDTIQSIWIDLLDPAIVDGSTLSVDGSSGKLIVKSGGIAALQLATDAVEEAKIKAKAVSLGKMADLARGSVILGNSSGVPAAFSAKTSGAMLLGDGTDLTSVVPTGDVTVTAGGVWAIGANKVLDAMVNTGALLNRAINAAAGIVFTKMVALTASMIPQLNASGFIESSGISSAKLPYIDVTPGTLTVSKAVVVGATGKIDTLDIIAPKINGVALTATAAQLNYSNTLTGDVQTQIDAGIAKVSSTVISANTAAVAATLKSNYIADTGTGSVELTLPQGSTLVIGTPVRLLRMGANAATLKPYASDTLYPVTSHSSGSATVACSGDGKGLNAILTSANTWQVVQMD
jgi:hypothetical protein